MFLDFSIKGVSVEVIDYFMHDHDWATWAPEDESDFDEWIYITVGENGAGSDYQVHICTPISISRIEDKRYCYMVSRWDGWDALVSDINKFIDAKIDRATEPADVILSRHWLWEYEQDKRKLRPRK